MARVVLLWEWPGPVKLGRPDGRRVWGRCPPRCLLGLFDAAATGLADWSVFDAEAERWGIEVRGLSRQGLTALIEGTNLEIPTTEHRKLHQEASDFVPWGRRGAEEPWPSTAGRTSHSSPAFGGGASE
jgi:hypothetical protein